MRVAFFYRSYWPDLGATGQLLTELTEDLVRSHACEVSVVMGLPLLGGNIGRALARGWMPARRESRNSVAIFRAAGTTFRPRRFAARAANYASYFLSACMAGMQVPRPDVAVSLTDPPIIGLAAYLTARRSGAKFVFLCQDLFPEVAALLEDVHHERINPLFDRINRFLIRKADRVVALGETMRERLIAGKGADRHNVHVIHKWADRSALVPASKQNPFSRSHGLHDVFVIMHSGNLGFSQHVETLLDAADRLRSFPDLLLLLVGDGTTRATLETSARHRNPAILILKRHTEQSTSCGLFLGAQASRLLRKRPRWPRSQGDRRLS